MKIKKINWIFKEAQEAEVVITDGMYEVVCFSQPCSYKEGDIINDVLYAYNPQNILLSNDNEVKIDVDSKGGYLIIAKVIDIKRHIISIGNISIEIDGLPGDIVNGDIIKLSCTRIDVF